MNNPYSREEFIMSIHLNQPFTAQKIQVEAQEDAFSKTIQKSEQNAVEMMKQDPIKRKQKLVYELEVKDKMRKIQMK